jgi:RNA polymerase sigma factor (sigma-70 family)
VSSPHSVPSDDDLLVALRGDDVEAFETLYVRYAIAVHAFVQSYVTADVADDLVHDVFLSLWHRRHGLEIVHGVRAWLFGAIRLRAQQHRRNTGTRERRLALSHPEIPQPTPSPAPDEAVVLDEVRTAVGVALATLPDRTRELLTLRWVHGLSYREASEVLGLSVEAAKKLGKRAEHTLLPLLDPYRR